MAEVSDELLAELLIRAMGSTQWTMALPWLNVDNHTPTAADAAALEQHFAEHPEQLQVQDGFQCLPLHHAAWKQRGEHAVAIVAFLLEAYAAGVQHTDNESYMPLHLSAEHQKGEHGAAIVTLLLTAHPDAARHVDGWGLLPADGAKVNNNLPVACKTMLRAAAEGNWHPPRYEAAFKQPHEKCEEKKKTGGEAKKKAEKNKREKRGQKYKHRKEIMRM